jgi:hypothetical protein
MAWIGFGSLYRFLGGRKPRFSRAWNVPTRPAGSYNLPP